MQLLAFPDAEGELIRKYTLRRRIWLLCDSIAATTTIPWKRSLRLSVTYSDIGDTSRKGPSDAGFFPGFKRTWVTRVTGFWHNQGYR